MQYLLLIPIAAIFGAAFFALGWHSRVLSYHSSVISQNQTREQRCSPRWIYFKADKRIFPHPETVDQLVYECDTILEVVKCRYDLTDIMVVFKSKFTAVNGRLRDFNAFPCLTSNSRPMMKWSNCSKCGSEYLGADSRCPTCASKDGV
jgi:hypothetical protein